MEPKKDMLKRQVFDAQSRIDLIKLGKDHIVVDRPAPYVTRITLNRENHFRNALANETRAALFDQLQFNDQDPDCRVTVIRGSNGIFCSGYDIPDRKTALPTFTSETDGQQQRNNVEGWFMINDLAKPVIASVEGECLGGGMELAAACDIVLVATDAVIGYPAIRGQGLPDFQVYPWLMGHRNAMEVMLTNRQMSGEEAVERGFATACYPPSELEAKTLEFANRVAKIPADLLAFNKRSVHRAFETMGFRTNIRNGLDLEALMFKAPGAKMLVARRVTKPGEARSPPPRPNSSQPPAVNKEVPLSAPPSLVALSGPVVGASAVSATPAQTSTSSTIQKTTTTPPASKPSEITASAAKPSPITNKVPVAKATSPKVVAKPPTSTPTPPKVATATASPTQASKAASPAAPKLAAPSAPVKASAAPQTTKPSQPATKAAPPKPVAYDTKNPASQTLPKPIETKSENETTSQASSSSIKIGPKRIIQSTNNSVAPKKVSAESASVSPSKDLASTSIVETKTTQPIASSSANKKSESKIVAKSPELDEYTDEDGIHIHLHDEINIHIHNDKSKL